MTRIFIDLYENGRAVLQSLKVSESEVLVGREEFMERMGSLYDEHSLSPTDIALIHHTKEPPQ